VKTLRNAMLITTVVIGLLPINALAISKADSHAVNYDTTFYDPNDYGCTATIGSNGPVVVLDPGHSGGQLLATQEVDSASGVGPYTPVNITGSGVESIDSGGAPGELATMWTAANKIKDILVKAGYKVILTKQTQDQNVGLLSRVKIANDAKASIAVSLHYTGGVQFGTASDHWGVTPQATTMPNGQPAERTNASNGKSAKFTDTALAATSLQYAQAIQQARAAAGDPVKVAPLDNSFPQSRRLPAFGNISIVQLFSKVPWVYNEDGDIGFDVDKYSTGIANGIEKAVPVTGAPSSNSSVSNTGCCGGGGTAGSGLPTLVGKDALEQAFNALMASSALGLNPAQVSGILGNLMVESGGGITVIPDIQFGGARTQNPNPGIAYGIAQWLGGRQAPLIALAKKDGVQVGTLAVQIEYLIDELTGNSKDAPGVGDYSSVLAALKKATSPADAATVFFNQYEKAGDTSLPARITAANLAFKLFGNGAPANTGSGLPCAVNGSGIVATALEFAWPKPDCTQTSNGETRGSCFDATKAYQKGWDKAGGSPPMTDCGAYVASVVIDSKADPNYPPAGTWIQEPYVIAHPNLYQPIPTKTSARLQAGDLMIASYVHGGTGHTAIFVGTNPGYDGTVAAASWGGHTPHMEAGDSNGQIAHILADGSPEAAVRYIGTTAQVYKP
jgi:N-acetylmuramoyl-L-alanine amidase